MRRILLAGAITGAVFSTAACGGTSETSANPTSADPTSANPTPAATSTTPAPTPSPSRNDAADVVPICGEIDKSLVGELRYVGADLGRMIAHRQAGDTARANQAKADTQEQLRGMATRMRKRTATAQAPELTAAGRKVAANIDVTARNDAFFAKVKSIQGVESLLRTEAVRWLMPLNGPCAT